ncbi:MAG: HigA family addiction module antidote protein [Nitrospirae bacterium]|nr:HigA family addiction module antidote protein [Nitrospirota bacterium]
MATNYDNRVWPDTALHPGEFLQETIDAIGLSQAELAERMGRPKAKINQIINGAKSITEATALELERVLGTPAYIWVNLDRDYQFNKARLHEMAELRKQAFRLVEFPLPEMARRGWLKRYKDKSEQLVELLNFFGVASFEALEDNKAVAFKRSTFKETSPGSLAAWIRKGEIEASAVETLPFDALKLKSAIADIRKLSTKPPEIYMPEIIRILASCGVALVIVHHLPKSYVDGAAYWLNPEKAVIQLSLRYKTDDNFWFSLFHELGHILLHPKREIFLDDFKKEGQKEHEANSFAEDRLIPAGEYRELSALSIKPYLSTKDLESFADRLGLAPGIIIGRMHHEKLLPRTHMNKLKKTVELSTAPAPSQ